MSIIEEQRERVLAAKKRIALAGLAYVQRKQAEKVAAESVPPRPLNVVQFRPRDQLTQILAPNRHEAWNVVYRRCELDHSLEIGPSGPRIARIQHIVASHFEVTINDLCGARRTARTVQPRQIAMYLSKQLTLRSLPQIGRMFGDRDHTTVLHAIRKIEGLRQTDRKLSDALDNLTAIIMGH